MCEISIIMPVYNKARYIQNVLFDVQKQGFCDFECIIIDDGSTDLSGKICDDFAAQDTRFCVFHIPNSGVSHARNVGLARATGEYVTFIDADDRVAPDYLMRLFTDVESSQADMVIAGLEKFWVDGRPHVMTEVPYTGAYSLKQLMPEFAQAQKQTGIYGYGCGKLIRRDITATIQFSEWLHLAEDFEFYLRIYPKVKTIYFDDKCKYQYLQEAENSSAVIDSARIDYVAQLKINLYYREFLQNAGYYAGTNRSIVDGLVADYAFFSVFHCERAEIPERIKDIRKLLAKNNILVNRNGLLKSALLFCIRNDFRKLPRTIMRLYDVLRSLKRRL